MRIVIDMQGAQTESRFRGIGRYSLSLAQGMARNAGHHEIHLALNGLLPDSIPDIRDAFRNLLPQERIHVWHAPGPTREVEPANTTRRRIAECIREAFLHSLEPDFVIVTSLFEGFGDDAIASVGALKVGAPTAVILYDLIPLINPDIHFRSSQLRQDYYAQRLEYLRRSDHLLAISESARNEAVEALPWRAHRISNVSGGYDAAFFRPVPLSDAERGSLMARQSIARPFIMYTGGADERKNLSALIRAYSCLSRATQQAHQLVLAGKMPESEVRHLLDVATQSGLQRDDVIFTGYVSDEDLRALYCACEVFAFPSLHEGFGLPPLEAMACGAAVVAANATSLPEVMGWTEAMFDPASVEAIRDKLEQALTDPAFRAQLIQRGLSQAQRFSWDRTAKLTLDAIETASCKQLQLAPGVRLQRTGLFAPRHPRILVLKLDHFGDLLLAIPAFAKLRARYPTAEIDVVVGSWNQTLARRLPYFSRIHTLDYFKRKSAEAGLVTEESVNVLAREIGSFDLAIDLRRQPDTRFVLTRVSARLKVGYRSYDEAIDAHLNIGLQVDQDAPQRRTEANSTSISQQMLALVDALPSDPNDYIHIAPPSRHLAIPGAVALFPYAGNDVKEWGAANFADLARRLGEEATVSTIHMFFATRLDVERFSFAGLPKVQLHVGLNVDALIDALSRCQLCVANNSGGAHLAAYLGLKVIGVYGGHETVEEWGPVFGQSYVLHRDAACSPCHIATRDECKYKLFCLTDIPVADVHALVMSLGFEADEDRGLPPIKTVTPDNSGNGSVDQAGLARSLAPYVSRLNESEMIEVAKSISASIRSTSQRSLFIDVSELVQRDAKTGIQRVTRSILTELLRLEAEVGYRTRPVYATAGAPGYCDAHAFLRNNGLAKEDTPLEDMPISFHAGDIFLGLDLHPMAVVEQAPILRQMHNAGVRIVFVVYDLLPIRLDGHFADGMREGFAQWLDTVTEFDGAICISQVVADEVRTWVREFKPARAQRFDVRWFHIGADIENSQPTLGMPDDSEHLFARLATAPTFLMVGTLEPRKGHSLVLDAFEALWRQGVDANLVIVGRAGWLVDTLADRIGNHAESRHRLFWLAGISDEYLEKIYSKSTCLMAASEGEGFGLPLIEAARHGLPIIASDMPVFHEVAGPHAFYFDSRTPEGLASAISAWLELHRTNRHPHSVDMPWLTWQQSTQDLLARLLEVGAMTAAAGAQAGSPRLPGQLVA